MRITEWERDVNKTAWEIVRSMRGTREAFTLSKEERKEKKLCVNHRGYTETRQLFSLDKTYFSITWYAFCPGTIFYWVKSRLKLLLFTWNRWSALSWIVLCPMFLNHVRVQLSVFLGERGTRWWGGRHGRRLRVLLRHLHGLGLQLHRSCWILCGKKLALEKICLRESVTRQTDYQYWKWSG